MNSCHAASCEGFGIKPDRKQRERRHKEVLFVPFVVMGMLQHSPNSAGSFKSLNRNAIMFIIALLSSQILLLFVWRDVPKYY